MYTTERPLSRPAAGIPLSSSANSLEHHHLEDLPPALDPMLLQIAQHVYRTFYEVHPDYPQKPVGVVINQISLRAQLVFKDKPVLLIQECLIPLSQIEA